MSGMQKFKSKEKFDKMLKMIADGVSDTEIARYFEVDRTTIIFHRKKQNIVVVKHPIPREHYTFLRDDFDPFTKEKINPGYDYSWYAAKERKRNPPKTLQEVIAKTIKRQKLMKMPPILIKQKLARL